MRTRLALVLLGVVALAGGVVACGGDDDNGGDGGGNGEAAQNGGDSGSPEDVRACIEKEGLELRSGPANEASGITESIQVDVGSQNRVIVNFFDDPARAKEYAEGQDAFLSGAGAGGGSEVVGETTVVGVARSGAEEETEKVKACLGS